MIGTNVSHRTSVSTAGESDIGLFSRASYG
jgi:hypothetical protein